MSRKLAILLPLLVAGVFLDQVSKFLVVQALPLEARTPVIRGFFNLVHVRNRGAAFGLLANLSPPFAWAFFLVTTTLVLAAVLYLFWRLPQEDTLPALGYSLIFTGALGNLVDRIRLGEVIDFLDFHLGRYHWPAFNVADSLVCLGAGLLLWAVLREDKGPDVSHPL